MFIFLLIATVVSLLAAITVFIPGSFMDKIWAFKQAEYQQLLEHPVTFGTSFVVLAVLLSIASYGWLLLYRWGWRLTTVVITLNVLSDIGRTVSGSYGEAILGITIGGLVLYYLFSPNVRNRFNSKTAQKDGA